MNTATNRESRWLFPGRRAGQPSHPRSLSALVHALGAPMIASRAAAIRQHVLDMPAPVVATAVGYHHVTTTRLASKAGATWSRSLDQQPPNPPQVIDLTAARVQRRPILGGLINEYTQAA